MKYFIDIHCHCLPQVDDGAKSIEETLAMMKIAYEEGIRTIIATPHFKGRDRGLAPEKLEEVVEFVNALLVRENIGIKIYRGNELFYNSEVSEILREGRLSTLADSSYVLVEFYPNEDFRTIKAGLYDILSSGYVPVLAHVERYKNINKIQEVEELLELGVYIQVNASSILGDMGRSAKSFVKKLLKKRYVHFVASDAHSPRSRAPRLITCASYLEKKYGSEYVEELFYYNPMMIIENELN